jgi:hypothetical protein
MVVLMLGSMLECSQLIVHWDANWLAGRFGQLITRYVPGGNMRVASVTGNFVEVNWSNTTQQNQAGGSNG